MHISKDSGVSLVLRIVNNLPLVENADSEATEEAWTLNISMIAKDAKIIKIEDQLPVSIKRQVETELMLEEKFRDLCENVSKFIKEGEDVVKEVESLSCKDVGKKTVRLLRRGQKRDLYKMTRLQMMVNESHLSVREKQTFVSKMKLGTIC
ncbi:hypothetical protein Tco_0947826 [Tanacetum coccineum]